MLSEKVRHRSLATFRTHLITRAVVLSIVLAAVGHVSLVTLSGRVIQNTRTVEAQAGCTSFVTRTLSSSAISQCEVCNVTMKVQSTCIGDPVNVVLVVIGLANESGARFQRQWTGAAIDAIDLPANPHVRVGVVLLGHDQSIRQELTNKESLVREALRISYHEAVPGARPPCFQCAFELAKRVLDGAPRSERRVIVYVGSIGHHGPDSSWYEDWIRGARRAKAASDLFIIGCGWVLSCKPSSDWWREASPGFYFEGEAPGRFAAALEEQVSRSIPRPLASIEVKEAVPDELQLIEGSASPPTIDLDPIDGKVRWRFTAPITSAITLTYRARPLDSLPLPLTTTFSAGHVVITDTTGAFSVVSIPSTVLTITEPCAPTASSTPPPTDTPATTPTSEPTATTRPSPTATATPIPAPLFLPVALSEAPCTRTQRADVVLVIDASTSMNEPAGDGRTKLVAARDAARLFLDRLRLDAGDQAAVVGFNRDARLLVGLTDDPAELAEALDRLDTASETCLVCGLEAAGAALGSDARRPGNSAVVILLTDGRSNPRPASEAVEESDRLKALGHVIFTIGLGADLDDEALVAIASRPAFAHSASDGAALEAIYRELAVTLPGPADCYWGRRP